MEYEVNIYYRGNYRTIVEANSEEEAEKLGLEEFDVDFYDVEDLLSDVEVTNIIPLGEK